MNRAFVAFEFLDRAVVQPLDDMGQEIALTFKNFERAVVRILCTFRKVFLNSEMGLEELDERLVTLDLFETGDKLTLIVGGELIRHIVEVHSVEVQVFVVELGHGVFPSVSNCSHTIQRSKDMSSGYLNYFCRNMFF